jgi:hypothetical protein
LRDSSQAPADAERSTRLLGSVKTDDDAVTLSNVTMVWSSGDGVKVLTLRVNPDSISAWWLGGGQPITM